MTHNLHINSQNKSSSEHIHKALCEPGFLICGMNYSSHIFTFLIFAKRCNILVIRFEVLIEIYIKIKTC